MQAYHSEALGSRVVDETLYLSIRDNGIGGAASRKGSGIIGLKDRVDVFSGRMTVNSPAGAGTIIDVTIPLAMTTFGIPTKPSWMYQHSEDFDRIRIVNPL